MDPLVYFLDPSGGLGRASGLEIRSPDLQKTRFPSSTLLPFFFFLGSLITQSSRKKGTLIIKGLLGNLV